MPTKYTVVCLGGSLKKIAQGGSGENDKKNFLRSGIPSDIGRVT